MAADPSTGATVLAFDWNGTIVDDLDRAVRVTNLVLARHGRAVLDRDQFRHSFRLPLDGWLQELGLGGCRAEWNDALATEPAPLRAGVRAALTALRAAGTVLAVVSAADAAAVGGDIEHAGLAGLFDHVGAGVDDKAAHLAALAARYGTVCYLGDTEFDVAAAGAAGCVALAIVGGWRPERDVRAAGAAAVLESFTQLPALLRRLQAARRAAASQENGSSTVGGTT